tara:strand:+ start:265 stop:414 length:150 start_codon:yes stop_codon:yes gene_type:complete
MKVNTYTVALEPNQGHASAIVRDLKKVSKEPPILVRNLKTRRKKEAILV